MKLHTFWPWRRTRPASRPCQAALPELPQLLDDADDVPPPGCGWFNSSHELQRGLLVTEHASADAVAAELPLDSWIGLHLAGWQPAVGRLQ
jgi:hypothetical protein